MRCKSIAAVITALTLLTGCFAAASPPAAEGVAVDLGSKRPAVLATIGRFGDHPVIFDTGAEDATIKKSFVAPLKLEVVGVAELGAGVGKPVMAEIVELGALSIGGHRAAGTAVVALPDELAPFGQTVGIFSPSMFPDAIVELDLATNRLRIGASPRAGRTNWIPIATGQKLTTTLIVAGVAIPVTIDTGNPRALVLPKRFMKDLPLRAAPRETAPLRTIEANSPTLSAPIDAAATLAGHPVILGEVQFADWPGGNIGTRGLAGFIIVIDNPNKRWALLGDAAGPISNEPPQ